MKNGMTDKQPARLLRMGCGERLLATGLRRSERRPAAQAPARPAVSAKVVERG